jgi:hypothetical protein
MNIITKFKLWLRRKPWVKYNPIYWAIFGWSVTLGGIGVVELAIETLDNVSFSYLFFPLALILLVSLLTPLLAILGYAKSYPHNEKTLKRIIFMYIALILICANINFIIVFIYDSSFNGIHPVWELSGGQGRVLHWGNIFLSVVDCVHYSFVTLSTLGYGDMYPTKWYSKLAVDIELLMGLGITVLTVGRYFSRKNA